MKPLAEYLTEGTYGSVIRKKDCEMLGPVLNHIDLTRAQFRGLFGQDELNGVGIGDLTGYKWYLHMVKDIELEKIDVPISQKDARMLCGVLNFADITKATWKQIFGTYAGYPEYLAYVEKLEEFGNLK